MSKNYFFNRYVNLAHKVAVEEGFKDFLEVNSEHEKATKKIKQLKRVYRRINKEAKKLNKI